MYRYDDVISRYAVSTGSRDRIKLLHYTTILFKISRLIDDIEDHLTACCSITIGSTYRDVLCFSHAAGLNVREIQVQLSSNPGSQTALYKTSVPLVLACANMYKRGNATAVCEVVHLLMEISRKLGLTLEQCVDRVLDSRTVG